MITQPPGQDTYDGAMQGPDLARSQPITDSPGMDSRLPQCFIHINITQSGQKGLIQQQRLYLPPPFRYHSGKALGRKARTQWFGAKPA